MSDPRPIPFNRPAVVGNELLYIREALESGATLAGDGPFSRKCEAWFRKTLDREHVLLTSSCTAALEMSALLADIKPGDEVILPSFTFTSTATAFALRGARLIFVDIRPDTLNIDETLIEAAITPKTKVIIPVHYAGVACEMDAIMAIARKHQLLVVEDAAQAMLSSYKGQPLGTIGDLGCYSFHETKNFSSGEGGLLIVNNRKLAKRAEIIREKGTNRSQFFRGEIDKYSWVDIGSSYLASELQAAFLYAQLEEAEAIDCKRREIWTSYFDALQPLAASGHFSLPSYSASTHVNAHIFFLITPTPGERNNLLQHLKQSGVHAIFHYVPLHSSPAGQLHGSFTGTDRYTTDLSERLVRLPIHWSLTQAEQNQIIHEIHDFFSEPVPVLKKRGRKDEL